MDWKIYEEITSYIYETLGKEAKVKIEGHGNNCRVKGKSGVEHQIDVLASHTDGIHTYKTAIECKYWEATINKDIIMKVAEIIEDADINKGVIVSKNGFTEDAISFAKYKNIGLVELREARDEDLVNFPKITHVKSWVKSPRITRTIIKPSLFNTSKIDSEEVDPRNVVIKKHTGEIVKFTEIQDEFIKELKTKPVNISVEKMIFLPMSEMINNLSGKSIFIDGILFMGILIERDAGIKFYPIDEVWLIMKSLFEDKAYTISRRGIINEKKI